MRKEEALQGFSKGLVKDIADTIKENTTYKDAVDIRLNSNSSSSDYILTNVKGTKFSFVVPDTPRIMNFELTHDLPNPLTYTASLLMADTSIIFASTPYSGNGNSTSFFDYMEDAFRNDPSFAGLDLNVSRQGTHIRIWSYTADIDEVLAGPFGASIDRSVQVAQTGLKIIGWDNIDNEIYLFTTNDDSATGGIGAIFKFTYDTITLAPTIELKYTAELNFTTRQPIANPGGIESIYETAETKRIYWTDRMNDLRTINIGDPNVMSVDPENLALQVSVKMRKPTLDVVSDTGSLITGHYQVAYALRTEGGAITPYSHTSNSVVIVQTPISATAREYRGNDSYLLTNKAIKFKFTDIDTSFAFMDIIILRKEDADASPIISKVAEIAINAETMYYTHAGTETAAIITENDFTAVNNLFVKCHAIAQKDNMLFAANTKSEPFDIDFDARAYRWNNGGTCDLEDISGNIVNYNQAALIASQFQIPETEDAINPDQTVNRYQADGMTIGGEGVNIKYRFTTNNLMADVRPGNDFAVPWKIPWRQGVGNISLGDGVIYQHGDGHTDISSPYHTHVFRGYRRGETYRFAWVPVKDGKEGYARWIGDIRMPDIFENYVSGDPYFGVGDTFPLLVPDNNKWKTSHLGVRFEVSIPSDVADKIDGYRIKRVKLEPEDRTILAQGFLHQTRDDTVSGQVVHNLVSDFDGNPNTLYGLNADGNDVWPDVNPVTGLPNSASQNVVSFHAPDFLFGRPVNFLPGDKLRITGGLGMAIRNQGSTGGHDPATKHGWFKMYWELPVHLEPEFGGNPLYDIVTAANVGMEATQELNGPTFENHAERDGSNGYNSIGTDTTVLQLDRGLPKIKNSVGIQTTGRAWTNTRDNNGLADGSGVIGDWADKLIANYERPNTEQYGGRGYSARSTNIYIPTGAEIILNGNSVHSFEVYGGDVFVNIFDSLKMTKNFASVNDADRRATAMFYPTESFVNTDLREGFTCNQDFGTANYLYGGSGIPDINEHQLDYGEDFKYNYVFSEQMDTQRSFPIPINVNEVLEHPFRIWASGVKVYGEKADSWRMFDNEKYIDIRGDLGEIRQLINQKEQLLAWQERGFGVASVNERSILNDTSGSGIVIGKSGILPRFDYISNTIGAWHQFGFAKGQSGVMFFDAKDGGLYHYSQQGIRDVTDGRMKGWLYENTRGQILKNDSALNNNSPLFRAGICATYDNRNKEFLFTFHDATQIPGMFFYTPNSFTLAYHDKTDRFISFRSHKPTMYINDDKQYFSPDPSDDRSVYLHDHGDRGVFYGDDPSISSITLISNKFPTEHKIFDNLRWLTEVFDAAGVELADETFTKLIVSNPYQTTGDRTQFIRRMREWRHNITYEQGTKNRIRGHYAEEHFEFQNADNKEFKLHHLINSFRIAPL